MTAHEHGAGRAVQDLVALVSAAEALAVAIWLAPASIHIVKWPAEGPVRLALLAPAWQLVALAAVALLIALATAIWIRRRAADGRLSRIARLAIPFSMLWLWAVPYLPWIPDRLPLLLVLAGPIRWVILVAALVAAVLTGSSARARAARVLDLDRRTIFALSFLIYAGFGIYSARSLSVGGDEPHYLVITESLLRDGDLQIENNHQRRDYQSFWPGELRMDYFERGKNGQIYSIHAPGLPVLILPAYAVAGRLGAVVLLAFLAALTALAMFDLADAVAGRSAAVLAWAASCLTVPFIPYAWLIFPELPGALVVAWAACWTWQSVDRSVAVWIWRGAVLGTLPWFHTKFVVFLAIFGGALALRLVRRPRALAGFLTPMAIAGASWMYSFYAIYGVFDPEAPYGVYTSIYVLTRNIPHGLVGIFFDQKFGLLFYSPIYLTAIAGAWLILRRADTRFLGAVLLLAAGAFIGTTARLYMFWGGNSAPARFLVPILPCLAPLVALAITRARSAVSRALVGLWLAISLGVAVLGAGWPDRLMLFSDPHGRARLLEMVQGGSPLSLVVPTFTEPAWASQVGPLAIWLLAAAVAIGAVWLVSLPGRASACQLAGVACLSFLLAGAAVTAMPSGDVRSETARRGDLDVLWRFDGNRFRTLDYQALGRATPERFRDLTTVVVEPSPFEIGTRGYVAGPFAVPPGDFDVQAWFQGSAAREGEVLAAIAADVTVGRTAGRLPNPTAIHIELPIGARRLTVLVPDPSIATAISRIEIVPRAVVAAGERQDVPVRTIESLPGRETAYLVYSDEHAYPEHGVFWSRGTAATRLWVAPAGASRMTLTLSTGPMNGDVTVSVAGKTTTVAMPAGEVKVVSFDLPPGQRLVPLVVQSSVMFRPAEVEAGSTDMRGLGCQVRIGLE